MKGFLYRTYYYVFTKREKAPNKAHISSFVVLFSFLAPTNPPPSSPAMQHWIYLFSPRIIVGYTYIGTCISTHKFVHCRVVDNCRFVVVELPSRRRQRSNGIGIQRNTFQLKHSRQYHNHKVQHTAIAEDRKATSSPTRVMF